MDLAPNPSFREVRHGPAEPRKFQKACHEAGGMAERQAEENLDDQAGLDRSVAVGVLTATPP